MSFTGRVGSSHPHRPGVVMRRSVCMRCARQRLQVSRSLRVSLVVAEAIILWNVTVLWGHPEDTVAVALAIYALIFAMDERFTGAGWLFGAALAFQPLVLMMFPVLIVMGGKDRALGLIVRGLSPPRW